MLTDDQRTTIQHAADKLRTVWANHTGDKESRELCHKLEAILAASAAPAEGPEPFGWISKKDFESGSGVGLVGAKVHPDDVPLFTATTPTMSEEVRGDLQAEIDRLNAIINTPQADDFLRSVSIEAEHQRQRWPSECDAGKTPADWFWLVGYLGGKALHAHAAVNIEKAEHHVITTAAACANWHRAMFGKTNMRPGIDGDAIERIDRAAAKGGSDEQ